MSGITWTDEDIYRIAERGHSLHLQGCYREATVIFRGLVAADPENHYCREALAAAWLALEEPERAIEQLNVLLARQPGDLVVCARRLEAYLAAGNFPAAIRDFEFLEHLLPPEQVRRLELSLESTASRQPFRKDPTKSLKEGDSD
jgi:tetratricopeptide (TPR) repeat protein